MTTIHATTVGKTSEHANSICPVCHSPLRVGEQAAICPKCKTPHHAGCWIYNGNRCSQLGCNTEATVIGVIPEPAVMTQTANTYTPPRTPLPTTPMAPAAPRLINAALFGWLALLVAGLLIHWASSWQTAVVVSAVAVAIVAVFVEYRRLGGVTGLAPHINVICGLALGGLGLVLLRIVWPYALDNIPALEKYDYWVWVVVLALSVYIGAWGSSNTLAPDSADLVRRIAGLAIVYWVSVLLVNRGFDLPYVFLVPALAAVILVVIGLWDGQLVLDPVRLGRALLGALTMAALVFGLLYLVSEVDYVIELAAGWSFLDLDFTWRAMLAIMVLFGTSETGASFALGLLRFLGSMVVLAFILGTTYAGGFIGYSLAQDHLSSDLWLVGAAVGGVVGLVVGVMGYRVVKGLFK